MKVALEGPLLFYVWKYQPWQDMPTLNLYLNHLVGELTLITVTVKRTPPKKKKIKTKQKMKKENQKNRKTKNPTHPNRNNTQWEQICWNISPFLKSLGLFFLICATLNSIRGFFICRLFRRMNLPAAGRIWWSVLTTKYTILKGCSEFFMRRELTRESSAYRLTTKMLPGCNDMLLLSVK